MQYILNEEEYKAIGVKAVKDAGILMNEALKGLLEPKHVDFVKDMSEFGNNEDIRIVYDASKLDEFILSKFREFASRY